MIGVQEHQIPALAALAGEIWHEYFPVILSEEQIVYMVEKYQSERAMRKQTSHGYQYFFLMDGTDVVGYCGVHPEDGKLFLSKLYLKKEHRGKGYARKAFSFLYDFAKKQNLNAVWLTVNRNNAIAIRAYQNNGFTVICEQKSDIGNGFFMDDFVMEKTLSD